MDTRRGPGLRFVPHPSPTTQRRPCRGGNRWAWHSIVPSAEDFEKAPQELEPEERELLDAAVTDTIIDGTASSASPSNESAEARNTQQTGASR